MRTHNFSAGPGALPLSVLEEAQRDLVELPRLGASPLEVSHRGPWFTATIEEAEANLRELLQVPESHRILFCQGGASLQFSMVPMNLLRGTGATAAYVLTGSWGEKASREATKEGPVEVAWTGAGDGFVRVPSSEELAAAISPGVAYVHVTTNETIEGVQFPGMPAVPGKTTLVADTSSDFLSRPIDAGRYGLLYAGAQKNAGPAGVTVVIVREDLLARIPEGLPTMLDYRTYAASGSMHNTPPVFSIYVLMLVTRWILRIGGVAAVHERNRQKAAMLYEILDASPDLYRGHADPDARSLMNVTWRLPTEDLERRFLDEAGRAGMTGLKGHRSLGGIRASIYNAVPIESVRALVDLMRAFRDG